MAILFELDIESSKLLHGGSITCFHVHPGVLVGQSLAHTPGG